MAAASPPAKRQRKLVVLSSSDNEESELSLADAIDHDSISEERDFPILTFSSRSPAKASSRENSSSQTKATIGVGRTRASSRQLQKKSTTAATTVSPKKGKKTRQQKGRDESSTRSLRNFFQPATDEQRWSFHKSEVGLQQPQQVPSFVDELEEDIIEDDYDNGLDLEDFDKFTASTTKEKEKDKEPTDSKKFARTSTRRFILDDDDDDDDHTSNTKAQKDIIVPKTEESGSRKPWSEQYSPTNLDELAVHKKKVGDVRNWLSGALSGRSRHKLLILHGPAGSGKTSTMSLLSSILDFDIVEWRSPLGADTGNGQYSSLKTQFDDFLNQLNGFGGLDLGDSSTSSKYTASQTPRKRVILIEEFPTNLSRGSTALSAFQTSLRRYIASSPTISQNIFENRKSMETTINMMTPPIIVIISETMLGTSGSVISDNLTAHRLLGPELYANPSTTSIEFNSIAPTFMLKALQLVLKKEARHSMRQRIPGVGVLKRFSELGDIRSAISSLEFLCLRDGKSDGWGGRIASKSSKSSVSTPLTAMEKESLELITQRESSLGLFHAVGKVVYNKRDDTTDLAQQQDIEVHVAPPSHLRHFDRPKVSQVSVDDLMDKTGTDVHTFTAALHENYPPSCDGPVFTETLTACIENLSDSDILCSDTRLSSLSNSRNGVGTARGGRSLGYGASIDRLRQDEISFHVAVRGMLFSLPYPVRRKVEQPASSSSSSRRVGGAFKMYFPTSQRLWKEIEEVEGWINLWERHFLSDPSSSLVQTTSSMRGSDGGGVASWKKSSGLSLKQQHDTESQQILPSVKSREDMLLDYLPHLSKIIIGKNSNGNNPASSTSSVRGLDRITQFRGINASKEEDIPDDDELPAEEVDWSTDPIQGRPVQKYQSLKEEDDDIAKIKNIQEQLFLSDDDIED